MKAIKSYRAFILFFALFVFGAASICHAVGLQSYPKFKAWDANGVPLSGGKLYSFIPGTSTPKNTYSDHLFTVPNQNPVILDSLGEATVYLNGATKLVLQTATTPPSPPSPPLSPSGAGIDYQLPIGHTIGDSGGYSTLEAAITSIGNIPATLRLPAANYNISTDFTIPSNITIKPERGAVFYIATTKTLTINGSLDAGLYQIFSCTGTGKVVFGTGSVLEVHPKWWGASSAALDQSPYINAASLSLYNGVGYGTVLISQTLQINNSVLLYPFIKLDCSPGAKLVAGTAVTDMVKSFSAASVDSFRIGTLRLDGNSQAVNALNISGVNESVFDYIKVNNVTGDGVLGDRAVQNTFNNKFGYVNVGGCTNGINLTNGANSNHVEFLEVYGATGSGMIFYGVDISLGKYYGLGNANHLRFKSLNCRATGLYLEGGTNGIVFDSGSYRNEVTDVHYDTVTNPVVDNGDYGNIYPNDNEHNNLNYFSNGDFKKWASSTKPLGWNSGASGGGSVTRVSLNAKENAIKLAAAGAGQYGNLYCGLDPFSPLIKLIDGSKSLSFGITYKRMTTSIDAASGSMELRLYVFFYDKDGNQLSTPAIPSINWTTVINDTTWQFYRYSQIIIPATAEYIAFQSTLYSIKAGDNGSILIKNVAVSSGMTPAEAPRELSLIQHMDIDAADPNFGTYQIGDLIFQNPPGTGKKKGIGCSVAGTQGTLAGVTGGITINTKLLTVNSVSNLFPGAYITIVGVTGVKRIISISALICTVDVNADATVAGAAVAYSPATFFSMGTYP